MAALLLVAGLAMAAGASRSQEARVMTGAEVLAAEGFAALSGQRVGLIANHTARVGEERLLDVLLRAPSVEVVAVFAPEHGFEGEAAAGIAVADRTDGASRIAVHSLYGRTRQPTPAMLEGIDTLVFDIQDVGARPYTYVSTMGLAMQAAARAGVAFHVLDRPNPLGGMRVEGFMLDPSAASFVGLYPVPMTHGLTVGELARMMLVEGWLADLQTLDLRITPMASYSRQMLWPDTGLAWVAPSPNLPTFEAALAYPGTVLLEATRASEGRGTDAPFTLFGAPGVDGARLAARLAEAGLPGVSIAPTRFTPRSIPGVAPNPKHEGRTIEGVRLTVTDPAAFRPERTGIAVLHALWHEGGGAALVDRPGFLKNLGGTDRLFALLSEGAGPDAIAAAWQDEAAAFDRRRRAYLLPQYD